MIGRLYRWLGRCAGYAARLEYRSLLAAPQARLQFDPAWAIALLAGLQREVTFIQVGANDGMHDDPLHAHLGSGRWRGVLIEPEPKHFERLQATYRDNPRLTLLNAAVGSGQSMTFHSIDPTAAGLPGWTRGIGSFVEANIRQHVAECPALAGYVRRREIPTITINDVLGRLGTTHVDLVLTDVEGYDAELLRQIDLKRWRPQCLYYESRHLSRAEHDNLLHHLIAHGYLVAPGSIDSVAVQPGFPHAVL